MAALQGTASLSESLTASHQQRCAIQTFAWHLAWHLKAGPKSGCASVGLWPWGLNKRLMWFRSWSKYLRVIRDLVFRSLVVIAPS